MGADHIPKLNGRHQDRLGVWFMTFVAVLLFSVAACGSRPVPPPATPAAESTPTSAAQPAATPTAVVTPTNGVTDLIWWTPEFLSPSAPEPAGLRLAEYLAEYETARDGAVRVVPVLKAKYGKGGLLDYLRTAQPVAPSIMPDIVALDVAELEQAAELGLLRPLDGLVAEETVAGLYPFARSAGRFGDQQLALQYIADLEQAVYDRGLLQQPPQTWAGLLSSQIAYAFPAGNPSPPSTGSSGGDVQLNFISRYLSAGGSLDAETRQLVLQEEPLQRVLTFYDDARKAGLLPANIQEITNLDDTWTAYVEGAAPVADVSTRRYLAEQQSLRDSGLVPIPGWSGPAVPVATGWALAIVTPDPERQKAAADFITWLLDAGRAGNWTQAAGWLPASPAALATWKESPLNESLGQQLGSAVSRPVGPEYAQAAPRIQQAIQAVLKGESTPAEAAQTALSP